MKTATTDMTTGKSAALILRFSVPLLIGNLFQQFYNMVDSLIVGNFVGADALAAVGTCGPVNFLFFAVSNGLAIGIGIIISQYFGAGDEKNLRATIANAVYILTGVSLIVSVIAFILAPQVLRLLATPESILHASTVYLRTTSAGLIAIALYNGVASILRALGDSKTPLYFLIAASIVNVLLDLLFVVVCGWSVFGVALATIISQLLSAVTGIVYAYRKVPYFRLTKAQLSPQKEIIKNTFRLGIPVAMQNSMIAVSCIVLQGMVNSFGETVMAANTIINRIEQIVQQPYGSLGMALTTYSGQNFGAKKTDRVQKGFRQSVLMVMVFSLCLLPIAYGLGSYIAGAFVKDAEVISIASKALRITSLCYFALGMIYVPRAVLNGCGDAKFSLINGLTEVVCRIGYSQIFTKMPFLGFWGIWVTTGATWITTAIVCVCRYIFGKWKARAPISS